MSFEICDDYDFKEKRCLRGEDNCPYRYPDLDDDKKCKGAYFSRHLDGLDYWDMDDDDEEDDYEEEED